MRRMILVVVATALASGCAGRLGSHEPLVYPPELIDGTAIFGAPVAPAEELALLEPSEQMRAFVSGDIAVPHFDSQRFRRLMAKLVNEGFFIDQYDRAATYTAARTFEERKGNCLAYTSMFVVLARLADLHASFQVVQIRPSWDVESGYLVRNNHVNVLLENIAVPGFEPGELTVDFNNVIPDPDRRRHKVTDEYATSMFYANLAVDRLHEGDAKGSFAYVKRAILTEPKNMDLWINLGALYSIHGENVMAQKSYEVARIIDPKDRIAISGLAKSLRQQGRLEEAEVYAKLAVRYQQKNPYYHYAVAEQAFRNNAFEEALAAVDEAIRLKRNNARFYALKEATAQELGDADLAKESEKLKKKYDRGTGAANFTLLN